MKEKKRNHHLDRLAELIFQIQTVRGLPEKPDGPRPIRDELDQILRFGEEKSIRGLYTYATSMKEAGEHLMVLVEERSLRGPFRNAILPGPQGGHRSSGETP